MNNVLAGYIYSYLYLFLALLLSFGVRKVFKAKVEITRKIIHILAGSGWCILSVFLKGTIHTVVITCSFIVIAVISSSGKMRLFNFMEREDGGLGTVYFTISMALMAFVSYLVPSLFEAYGVGIISLSFGDGMAGLLGNSIKKHNKKLIGEKTLLGTLACIISTVISVTILSRVFNIPLSFLEICFIGFITGILELISGKFDNFIIPFGIMGLTYILT